MSVQISLKSKRLEYDMQIEEKITFIIGDSATGKSQMVQLIDNSDTPSVKINISNGFDIINMGKSEFNNYVKRANKSIAENKFRKLKDYWSDKDNFPITDSIIVIDDDNFVMSDEFAAFVNADKYNYYIIINRTQLSKIGYSIDEVYNFKADGKRHWIERKYNCPVNDTDCLNPDFIVTEGIGSDFKFFSGHYKNSGAKIINPSYGNDNLNTGGKDNLLAMMVRKATEFKEKKVILFIDASAFGAEYESLVNMCMENNITAYISKKYLSFEYLLLNTNLINDTGLSDFQSNNLLKYTTLEQLFTARLRQILSNNSLLTYSKSRLSVCFIDECCSNPKYRKDLCNKRLEYSNMNKLEALLKGTKFEYLLQWQ